MSTDVMIYANDLSKAYGSHRALDKVSFEVNRGEIVGFLGPNGAGKSTTMRILTCFISATAGQAKIAGYDVFDQPLIAREHIGYLPQRAPLYLEMTVIEYLRFASKLRNIAEVDFKPRARKVVEVCGLAKVLNKEIRELSHGYRQRVGLAQALIHDPPILILDEPTSDLDPNEKSEFLDYLKQIGKDRTVLLSTHNLNEVEESCARAIIVSRGRVVADGNLDDIRARSGGARYLVTAEGKPAGLKDALVSLAGSETVRELPSDAGTPIFELTASKELDLRGEIFRLFVQKNWTMLELRRDTETLEDVFRHLTIGDERRNRQIGTAKSDDSDEN
jgi:ABC-2 type transport system ATP-binding protein